MKKDIIFLLTGLALLMGLANISFDYFPLIKLYICGVGIYGAYSSYRNKQMKWLWIFGGIALFFNVYLVPEKMWALQLWEVITLVTGAILVVYFFRNIKVAETLKELKDVAKIILKRISDMNRKWKIRTAVFLCLLVLLLLGLWGRKFLLENFNERHSLVEHGAPWQVALAIKAGANINSREGMLDLNSGGYDHFITPLMQAALFNRNPEVIRKLVRAGANVNETATDSTGSYRWSTRWGSYPIELAAQNPNPEVIKALVQAGASVNEQTTFTAEEFFNNVRKPMPLIFAAEYNPNPEVIKTLIQMGADVNEKEADGTTPLMRAAKRLKPNLKIIELLIQSKADINARDNENRTAFDHLEKNAEARKNKDFAQLEKLLKPGDKAQPKT